MPPKDHCAYTMIHARSWSDQSLDWFLTLMILALLRDCVPYYRLLTNMFMGDEIV